MARVHFTVCRKLFKERKNKKLQLLCVTIWFVLKKNILSSLYSFGFVLVLFKFWIFEDIPNLYLRQHNICVQVKIPARNLFVFKLKVKEFEKVSL